jgi:hypothetical protein
VVLEISVLGLGYSVDKFSKRRKRGLSVISRPGGVNVEVGFCAKIEYLPMHNLHYTLLDFFVLYIHVEVNRLVHLI